MSDLDAYSVEIQVVNVVGMIEYGQELALDELADTFSSRREIGSVVYDPNQANWLQARLSPDETYLAIYRNGGCSIAGAESEAHFYGAVDRINAVMLELLSSQNSPEGEIKNIVATTNLGRKVPLELLSIELGFNRVEYEPEQFPALIFRGSNYVILVFASGKLLCTGLADTESVRRALVEFSNDVNHLF